MSDREGLEQLKRAVLGVYVLNKVESLALIDELLRLQPSEAMDIPTRTEGGVWMHSIDRTESVARMVAIDAMIALKMDPNDWRVRDEIISWISPRINATLDAVVDANR